MVRCHDDRMQEPNLGDAGDKRADIAQLAPEATLDPDRRQRKFSDSSGLLVVERHFCFSEVICRPRVGRGGASNQCSAAASGITSPLRSAYHSRQHPLCSQTCPALAVPNGTIIAPECSPCPQCAQRV